MRKNQYHLSTIDHSLAVPMTFVLMTLCCNIEFTRHNRYTVANTYDVLLCVQYPVALRPVHTGHPMRSELDRIWYKYVHTEHSHNLDSIRINPNPLPEVVSIRIDLNHTIVRCTWGIKRVWHACTC